MARSPRGAGGRQHLLRGKQQQRPTPQRGGHGGGGLRFAGAAPVGGASACQYLSV